MKARGISLGEITAADVVDSMASFYANERADDVELAADGDMLLFQWGVHDWGEGPAFDYDVTRQFIVADEEDAPIRQLSLTLRFDSTAELEEIGAADYWCSHPDEVDAWKDFVVATPASILVSKRAAAPCRLRFESV